MKKVIQNRKACITHIFAYLLLSPFAMNSLYAQTSHTDNSMTYEILSNKGDKHGLFLLDSMYKLQSNQNHKKAMAISEEMIQIADSIQSEKWLAIGYTNKAAMHGKESELIKAFDLYKKALTLYELINDEGSVASLLLKIGDIYFYLTEYVNSLSYYKRALKIATKLDDNDEMANAYSDIGRIHVLMKNYNEGISSFRKAKELSKNDIGIDTRIKVFSSLGYLFEILEQYDSSLVYFNSALLSSKQSDNKDRTALINGNIALIYIKVNNYIDAALHIQLAINSNKELNNHGYLAHNYISLGSLHFQKKEFHLALENYKKALSISQRIGYTVFLRDINEELGKTYEALEKHRQSLEHYQIYLTFKDSVLNIEKTIEFNKLVTRYELSKKQLKIENLQIEQQLKEIELKESKSAIVVRNYLIVAIILLFIVILSFVIYYKRKQTQVNQIHNALNDIRVEKNQLVSIVAHDLKNTLNNIYSIIEIFRKRASNLQDNQVSYLSAMQKNVQRVQVTLNNILNIDKLEDRMIQMRKSKVDMIGVLKDVLESNIFSAVEKKIHFVTNNQTDCLALGDERCIKEIFDNLISNSIKYSPDGKAVTINMNKAEQRINFSIHNEGKSVPSIECDNLFSRYKFSPQNQTYKNRTTSTGLGLSIVKKYINAMGGEIQYESENGFTLTFYLPEYKKKPDVV